MDFKGITWAGNIYQKFEAMCLEVEEVMNEDPIKYVENQVQKVDVTVKKFYAEVMQDLLPPSSVDPVKVDPGDLPLNPYTQIDINKTARSSILNIIEELDEKGTKYEDIPNLAAEESSLNVCNDGNNLSLPSPRAMVKSTHSDVCSRKNKIVGVHKCPIGVKRISKNTHPPKTAMTSSPTDRSSLHAFEVRNNCLVTSNDMNITILSEFVGNASGTENTTISKASVESSRSDQNLSAESVRQEESDSQSTTLAYEKKLLDESLRQKKEETNCKSPCHGLPTEPISTYTGNLDVEVIETEDVLEPKVEPFELVEKAKLEESCILVEMDRLDFFFEETQKHKSYKKKIREVLSSKLRPARKQDQHISHYRDLGEKNDAGVATPALSTDCCKRESLARDSCESDWELL